MFVEPPTLFSAGDAEDAAYRDLRDEVSEAASFGRRCAEELWAQYFPYADEHYLVEVRRDFNARFWEMYLTCAFLQNASRQGFEVHSPKPGPDILLVFADRRVWVEAVTATDGDPVKADSPVNEAHGHGNAYGRIQDAQIIMRYTTAIAEKHRKFKIYRRDGLIAEEDAYVIAVNSHALSHSWAEPEMPRILKAVFPIGAMEFLFDRKTMQSLGTRHQFRPAVIKTSGAPVSTEVFVDAEYAGISAVLHSNANACTQGQLGVDFILIHNPMAAHSVPRGLLLECREYAATPVKDGYELICHEPAKAGDGKKP